MCVCVLMLITGIEVRMKISNPMKNTLVEEFMQSYLVYFLYVVVEQIDIYRSDLFYIINIYLERCGLKV